MFWRKKRQQIECNHEWHHLQDTQMSYARYGGTDDACWIFCVKCEKDNLVYEDEWQRIKRKQEILKELRSDKEYGSK